MTDFDPTRRDPQAPVSPDQMRSSLGADASRVGGDRAREPGETYDDAGLTAHDQPAEGGREEAEEDRPGGSSGT